MPVVTAINDNNAINDIPEALLKNKRHLTDQEIDILVRNRNVSEDVSWKNVYVSDVDGEFCPDCVYNSVFNGYVVLGRITKARLQFHDLILDVGIRNSLLCDVVTGDDCVINNVSYLCNYHIGSRVMLFNVQELSCTNHSKFGVGIIKEDEPESNRIWIGVGNENDGRAVLAFEEMIPSDAFLWSRYREDSALMTRFIELTEFGTSKANDTYGVVEDDAVIKNCTLIKDAKIGRNSYIKGAFKLKNITVLSSPEEPSQIGEGVEMVNGIMGYGSHVFYQAVAVRFVIGRNCQLKYGARLLNSVLGDNSTVSCCELLNNLIFPFHEQHHNSSFLIASTVQGQSNIASNATIGSNHNSRSPDGEMIAGRGFWPGLCTNFKFDSRFASFVLVSKGNYSRELDITYPFSLVGTNKDSEKISIIPGYWFLYNMFAIVRNKFKFASRDKRVVKVQHIETNPLAPDTIQEVIKAIDRIVNLTAEYLSYPEQICRDATVFNDKPELLEEYRIRISKAVYDEERYVIAKDYIHKNKTSKVKLFDSESQKKYGAELVKPFQGYGQYRSICKYFAVESIMDWCRLNGKECLDLDGIKKIFEIELYTGWINAGGQVIPEEKISELFCLIKNNSIENWRQVHIFYDDCQKNYINYKARYALYLLEYLYSKPVSSFDKVDFDKLIADVTEVAKNMLDSSVSSRAKDYSDHYRSVTFRNQEEKEAVIGKLEENSFLKQLKVSTEEFIYELNRLFSQLG